MIRKTNQVSLSEAINQFLEQNHLREKIDEVSLHKAWVEIVGQNIEKYTDKIQIKNTELTIYITSAAMRNELAYNTEKIRIKVNEFFGCEKIKTIKLL